MPPVYVEYLPFDWIGELVYSRQHFAEAMHKAIAEGLDKAQTKNSRKDIIRLTSLDDIQALVTLLKAPHGSVQAQSFYDTRFLFDADGGETQIFVDANGVVSSGSRSWRLTSGEFARLKRMMDRIYAAHSSTGKEGGSRRQDSSP